MFSLNKRRRKDDSEGQSPSYIEAPQAPVDNDFSVVGQQTPTWEVPGDSGSSRQREGSVSAPAPAADRRRSNTSFGTRSDDGHHKDTALKNKSKHGDLASYSAVRPSIDASEVTPRSLGPSLPYLIAEIERLNSLVAQESAARLACEQSQLRAERELQARIKEHYVTKETMKRLQWDNAVVLKHLQEQSRDLAAVIYDSERYKSLLDERGIEVPQSVFRHIRDRLYKQQQTAEFPAPPIDATTTNWLEAVDALDLLPSGLMEAAGLDQEDKADFSGVSDLVRSVTRLQIRLRDVHVTTAEIRDERVAELENVVKAIESETERSKLAAEVKAARSQQEIALLSDKNQTLRVKLRAAEDELQRVLSSGFSGQALTSPDEDSSRVIRTLETKVESLTSVIESQSSEISSLRSEKAALTSTAAITRQELEYTSMSLAREKKVSEDLRISRASLESELAASRVQINETISELSRAEAKLDMSQAAIEQKDREINDWQERVSEARRQLTETAAQTETTLRSTIAREAALQSEKTQLEAELGRLKENVKALEIAVDKHERATEAAQAAATQTLSEKETRILELTCEIEEQRLLVGECKREIDEERTRLAEERVKYRNTLDKLEKIERQAALLKEQNPYLDFGVLEEQITAFQVERSTLKSELSALRLELEDKRSSLESQIRNTEALESATLSLKQTLDEHSKLIGTLEEEKKSLKNECNSWEAKFLAAEEAHEALKLSADKTVQDKDDLMENIRVENEQLQEKITSLEFKVSAAEEKAMAATNVAEASEQTLRLEIVAHGRDIQRLEDEKNRLAGFRRDSEIALSNAKDETAKINSKLVTALEEATNLRTKVSSLEAQLDEMVHAKNAVEALLRNRLDTLSVDGDDAHAQLADALRETNNLRQQVTASRLMEEKLRLDLSAVESERQNLLRKLEVSQEELVKSKATAASTASSPAEHDNHSPLSYTRRLVELQLAKDQLEADLGRSEQSRIALEQENHRLLEENQPLRKAKMRFEGEIASLKVMLESVEQDAVSYRQKYLELSKSVDSKLEAEKEQLTVQLTALEAEKAKVEGQIVALQTERDAATQKSNKLTAEVNRLATEVNRLSQLVKQETERRTADQTKVTALEAKVASLEAAGANAEIQKRYQAQLSNMQRLIGQHNAEKEALKLALKKAETGPAALMTSVDTVLKDAVKLGILTAHHIASASKTSSAVLRLSDTTKVAVPPVSPFVSQLADMKDFLEFVAEENALRFGEFTLKSGRKSPYFFNAGQFNSGRTINELGRFYAQRITAENIKFDVLLGPAYKGIPLAVATASELWRTYSRDVPYLLTRKEAKDHGEGGNLIGDISLIQKRKPDGSKVRVLLVDDVITAGTAAREVLQILAPFADNVEVAGLLIAFDRQERLDDSTTDSAAIAFEKSTGIKVFAVASISDLLNTLLAAAPPHEDNGSLRLSPEKVCQIEAYRMQYGA